MAQTETQWVSRALQAVDERRWLRHGLFWLVDTGLVVLFYLYDLQAMTDARVAIADAVLVLAPHLLATYALLYGVLPWLWRPHRRGRFVLLLAGWYLLSMALVFAFRFFIFVPLHVGVPSTLREYHVAITIGPYMLLVSTAGVAACLHLYRQWRQKELGNAQLTQENFQAELQLLKAQIHPHFLFNTLNNLYALTLKQSDQAPEVVERLTGLLQFMLEQGDAPLITLRDEVALLRNYIALEQLRYGPRLTLEFGTEDIPATAQIAPLLLLPLVENAFKHGSAEQVGRAYIRISLGVADNVVSCVIINSKSAALPAANKPPGIGLRNVRQRLQLLYPQRHGLVVEARDDTYTVRLALRLPAPVVMLARPPAWGRPVGPGANAARAAAAPAWTTPIPSRA